MTYNIRLENADESIINAFRSIVKIRPNIKLKIKKDPNELARKKAEIAELRAEVEQIEKDIISGKRKGYKDVDEMFRNILND